MPSLWTARAFGMRVQADAVTLPRWSTATEEEADLVILSVARETVEQALSGRARVTWETTFDDLPFALRRGEDGDFQMSYGDAARFHLSPDGRTLLLWAADPDDPGWQRLLLDTGLWCAAFLQGLDLLHAGAVEVEGAAVAIVGRTGGGKTSLTAELVRRGHPLVADDVVALGRDREAALRAHPAPPLVNLPLSEPPRPQPEDLGREIARFGDESWVRVDRVSAGPLPLGAVCLLERRRGGAEGLEPVDATALDLMPFHFGLPCAPERRRRVFETFADLAGTVPVLRVTADAITPPGEIGDRVLAGLADAPRPVAER